MAKSKIMRHSQPQPQPQPQTTFKFDLCSVAKLKQDYRVAKKLGLGLGKVMYGFCFCHT